jgi:hypothetical protein
LRQQLRRFHRAPEEIQRQRPPHPTSHGGQRDQRDSRGQHRGPRDYRDRGPRDSQKGHSSSRGHPPTAAAESPAKTEGGDNGAEENPPTAHGSDLGGPS